MAKEYCYLIIPEKGERITKTWAKAVVADCFDIEGVKRVVSHEYVKAVFNRAVKESDFYELVRLLRVKDQTTHSDIYLSNLATLLAKRSYVNGGNIRRYISILSHLMFNTLSYDYNEEARWFEKRAKRLRKAAKKITAEKDHGWEIEELKKAKLWSSFKK